jgi:hypothetical protein
MAAGIGGGGLPRVKEILAYLKSLGDTVITTGATKSGQVNLRAADGTELGAPGGVPLHVDVTGDFPDNVQGAVEQANADVDPILPGHRIKPIKNGGHANAAAPAAVGENQVADAWYDLNGRQHVALDDGSDATLGAMADAAVAAGAAGTISAKLRKISTDIAATRMAPATYPATGAGAIALTVNPAADFWFHGITLHLSAAPTTAGNLTVTVNPVDGAAYNTKLYVIDPSVGAVTDMVYQPDKPMLCKSGDTITVAYANADGRTYGLRAVVSPV